MKTPICLSLSLCASLLFFTACQKENSIDESTSLIEESKSYANVPVELDGKATSGQQEQDQAQRGFSRSVVISGIRCLITYLILPFIFPTALGALGPALGLVVGTIALASNVFSIRRFWRANHAWRKPITVIHLGVIALLIFLMVRDIQQLFG